MCDVMVCLVDQGSDVIASPLRGNVGFAEDVALRAEDQNGNKSSNSVLACSAVSPGTPTELTSCSSRYDMGALIAILMSLGLSLPVEFGSPASASLLL